MSKKQYSEAIAAQLRGAIAQQGITRKEVSERTGIAPRTLARYLNDPPQLSIDDIKLITDAIGVNIGDILEAADESLNYNPGRKS